MKIKLSEEQQRFLDTFSTLYANSKSRIYEIKASFYRIEDWEERVYDVSEQNLSRMIDNPDIEIIENKTEQ